MLDKRFWSTLLYTVILFILCVTIWQVTIENEHFSNVAVYSIYTSNSSNYIQPLNTLSPDDYQKLIDLNNFTFTMLNLPCNESSTPLLLILVHSNPKNFETRKILRETWGQNTHQVKVLFMTGLVKGRLKTQLEKENENYGDLIQGSFLDAYKNMTYKHVMVLKYAIYHCPQAKYILKTDDDVFVNIPLMINFLTMDLSPYGGSRMIFCTLRSRSMVMRSWRSKWRVSFKEYPAKIYPPYCPGWAILYSPDVVFELYKEAQKSDYFWIDDVHITGTLVDKINITHVNIDNLVLTKGAMTRALTSPSNFNQSFLYGAPNVKNTEIKALWEFVRKKDTHVSILENIS